MYFECPERALYTWCYFHEKSSNFIGQSTVSVDCPSKGLIKNIAQNAFDYTMFFRCPQEALPKSRMYKSDKGNSYY